MHDDARRLADQLERQLLAGLGDSSHADRSAAFHGTAKGPLGDYERQVEQAAFRVTAEQLDALRAGHSDDALFELTLCAAHGAARRRLDAGLRALDDAFTEPP
ncbi:MAG: hypothetical protein SFW67_10535 [Myxococcaceae bacterium]|nr:hypothetical protein [Myxococcaceae bacterium]